VVDEEDTVGLSVPRDLRIPKRLIEGIDVDDRKNNMPIREDLAEAVHENLRLRCHRAVSEKQDHNTENACEPSNHRR
jgi:hypothetical protein